MAWVKLDAKFRVHAKILALSPTAGWLWVCGLSYSNDHLTDGFIPARALGAVAPTVRCQLRYVEELVKAGLWEVTDGGWVVHDYHDYQPTAAEVKAKRDTVSTIRAEVGRRGGLAKAQNASSKPVANEKQNASPGTGTVSVSEEKTPTPSESRPRGADLGPDELIDLFNESTPDETPAVVTRSPERKRKARQYLTRFPRRQFWEETFAMFHKSLFLRGLAPKTNGHESFVPDFDWLLSKGKDGTENVVKVHDGRYR